MQPPTTQRVHTHITSLIPVSPRNPVECLKTIEKVGNNCDGLTWIQCIEAYNTEYTEIALLVGCSIMELSFPDYAQWGPQLGPQWGIGGMSRHVEIRPYIYICGHWYCCMVAEWNQGIINVAIWHTCDTKLETELTHIVQIYLEKNESQTLP